MLETIAIILCISILFIVEAMLRIVYGLNRRWGFRFIDWIVTDGASMLLRILHVYAGLSLHTDYSQSDKLPEQYLVVINHQSLLDILLFMHYFNTPRLRAIAKAELSRGVPTISFVLTRKKHCLIQRKAGATQAMQAIDEFAQRVKEENTIPVISPEGTRSRTGELGTFHTAGFRRMQSHYPLPVAVCALDGLWHLSHVRDILRSLKSSKLYIKVVDVLPAPQSKQEQVSTLEKCKELIQAQLDEWRGKSKEA